MTAVTEQAVALSQVVRDDALHAEVAELRNALELANNTIEQQQSELETCRVQRDAASAVADLMLVPPSVLADTADDVHRLVAHYWAVTKP